MPLIHGQAISYSPLLYRAREKWDRARDALIGTVVQPNAAYSETPSRLDEYAARIDKAFARAGGRLAAANLDALVVLVADRDRLFDATNTPQLHVFIDDEFRGNSAWPELGESSSPVSFRCDADLAAHIAEELTYHKFDVSESRAKVQSIDDPAPGAGAALVEPLRRLGIGDGLPIVPIHVNCHVEPVISGQRMAPFGAALAAALDLVPQRVALLASGGMSGEWDGPMAGWLDDVLDGWILERLRTGRSRDLGRIFDVESQALRGATREVRLWIATGAAMESAGVHAFIDEYIPFHHATVGTAFMHWER